MKKQIEQPKPRRCRECGKKRMLDEWRVCMLCWKKIFIEGEDMRTEVYLKK